MHGSPDCCLTAVRAGVPFLRTCDEKKLYIHKNGKNNWLLSLNRHREAKQSYFRNNKSV